ncbi:MAG: carboxypeptidase-like regulatory domain-containing protein [Deltaproteobacteria bacterium]|nr:carboxypeptidase-like regulatory domain-containing protein [Deltaproteobacteria bacterium]
MRIALASVFVVFAVAACGSGTPAEIDVGPPPDGFATSPPAGASGVCATQQWWTRGDSESSAMRPGYDCIDCHRSRDEGPVRDVMGTVFFGVDDEDDCRGIPAAQIDILDVDGNLVFSTTTNAAGNFLESGAMPDPYTARVVYEGRTREMLTPQTEGSCNRCHTAEGAEGAPGRILLP